MREKQSALNDIILASIHDNPGQTIAKTIDTVLGLVPAGIKAPSRDTIRRRISELGARGHLYLRDEIVVRPREAKQKTEKKMGNDCPDVPIPEEA
jgi:hypothetical protein